GPRPQAAAPAVQGGPGAASLPPPQLYPGPPVASGRLPPPRLYPIPPRPAPPPPRRHGPEGAPFSAGVGAMLVYRDDVGYRRLGAESPQVELDVFATYDVLQLGARAVLAAGLGYRFGEVGDRDVLLVTSHAASAELIARVKANW